MRSPTCCNINHEPYGLVILLMGKALLDVLAHVVRASMAQAHALSSVMAGRNLCTASEGAKGAAGFILLLVLRCGATAHPLSPPQPFFASVMRAQHLRSTPLRAGQVHVCLKCFIWLLRPAKALEVTDSSGPPAVEPPVHILALTSEVQYS